METSKLRVLAVGGDFGPHPRQSGYIEKLFAGIDNRMLITEWINGGNMGRLAFLPLRDYDIIIWFPNIPNHYDKLVHEIKRVNPKALLIISKNLEDRKCSHLDIISRALECKANLLVTFDKLGELVQGTLWDPLGNIFHAVETNPKILGEVIAERALTLSCFTRVGSKSIGPATAVPVATDFFDVAKTHAEKFHDLVHAVNQERFLGNLSFRCGAGFPSFRKGPHIYVSKRNIDKRNINENGFVAILPRLLKKKIAYYGRDKPSVDTPIQRMVYEHCSSINYMLHAHVYVENGEFTRKVIPCGAIEEFDEIKKLVSSKDYSFKINLLGHGCLIGSDSVDFIRLSTFQARPMPELWIYQ